MRIKTLLCLAALSAGVATTMAQSNVYSLNIVGYVNITQGSGFRIIANPLSQTNNDVQYLFPNAASYPGLSIYKFNGVGYDIATFDPDAGGWTALMQVPPGTGVWLQVPVGPNYSNTFVGEVVLNSTNPIPTGFSLKSSVVPQSAPIQATLGIPLQNNDAVYFFNGVGYDVFALDPDAGGWTPSEPSPLVAQGFWVQNNSGVQKNWIRNFLVGP
jgi:hypothetical protein